ncbi:MAG: oligosaccharide flippase family protein [Thermotogae bacterium]|nr:oligosaccharide flippase family protein [Thermotogota bacterium]
MKGPLFWTLASRVSIQLFALLRIAVLARILKPYDFGVATSAFIAYQMLDMMTFTGFTTALTAYRGDFRKGYSTLWWSTVLRGLSLALLLYALADVIGRFFNDPNVAYTTRLVALAFIPYSLVNPTMVVEASRFFRFEKIFVVEFGEALMYFLGALVFARIFGDFRALVFGFVVAGFTKLVLSYIVQPYLPRLSFSMTWLRRMFSFGIWVNFTFVLNFLLMYLDRTIVGKFAGQTALGHYSNAQRFAFLAPPQISSMLSRVLFPYFVSADDSESERAYGVYLRTVLLIGALFFGPMFFWNRGFINLTLGPGWEHAAEILRPLSLAGLLAMVSNTISPISQGKSMPRLDVFRLTVVPLVFILFAVRELHSSVWIAWSLALGYAASIPVSFWGIGRCGVSLRTLLLPLVPFSGALLISALLYPLNALVSALSLAPLTALLELLLFRRLGALELVNLRLPSATE